MTDRLRLATGTAEVLSSLRRTLAGDGVTVPLPATEPDRAHVLAMLRGQTVEPDAGAIVATSGSTGRPRGVLLSRSALLAAADAAHHRLGGPGSWVLALPVHYVAGLMVLVRSLVAGRPVRSVDGRLRGLAELPFGHGPHYVSLVPTQLTRALSDLEVATALSRFDAVLLGGAAADPRLLGQAEAAGVRVVTTYGMSETCGGCVYDGRPLDGVEVSLEPGTDRIVLAGPMLFDGYLRGAASGSSFASGDRGRWTEAGRLEVLGRLDATVISGGHNVDLDAVERELRHGTGVEIAVVGVPDPEWGTRVVAVGRQLSDQSAVLRGVLPAYAIPREWISVDELPRTAGGKIDRLRLLRDLGARVG